MTYSQQQLYCDSSTLAMFKQWAQPTSTFIGSIGFFTQAADTGQVNWSTISVVPGSNVYVYEIWQATDGLTSFYLKIEYGNQSSTNCPSLRFSLGTSTNGAGTLTGLFFGPVTTNVNNYTAPGTATPYECNFFGGPGLLSVMLWRGAPNNAPQYFCVERSVNSSGTYTGTYVTLYTNGYGGGTNCAQRSLHFQYGPGVFYANNGNQPFGWAVRSTGGNTGSTAFANSIPVDFPAPNVGFFDYSGWGFSVGNSADIVEGVTFQIQRYGTTITLLPSKSGSFFSTGPNNAVNSTLCMRIA